MTYIDLMMEKAGYPDESRPFCRELCGRLAADTRYEPLARKLLARGYTDVEKEILDPLRSIAAGYGLSEYPVILAFYMNATELLRDRYRENGLDEELFWFAVTDYRCKMLECRERTDLWGTMAGAWHEPFFHLERFALGRLQFDLAKFDWDEYEKGGYSIRRFDECVRIHIPSAGPLTRELRLDSYRRAYAFFRERFESRYGDAVPITCLSWLLFPGHLEMLPPDSNIVSFIGDFDIQWDCEHETFINAVRVFGRDWDLPPEQWPTKTALQRAYRDRMMAGKPAGAAYGAFFWNENGRVT